MIATEIIAKTILAVSIFYSPSFLSISAFISVRTNKSELQGKMKLVEGPLEYRGLKVLPSLNEKIKEFTEVGLFFITRLISACDEVIF